jgi:ATP-dependent DNA helicase DinG
VSTYANEGLDFIDAAARFCIIVKTPYPDLGDPQVRARTDRDRGWYENETLKSIIQMAGRIVRTPEDHGTTYILDANADTLIRRNPAAVPRWFLQAYRLASS